MHPLGPGLTVDVPPVWAGLVGFIRGEFCHVVDRKRSQCRSCDAEIEWAITEKNGRKMPLDYDPVPGAGNIVVVRREATEHGVSPVVRYVPNGRGDRTSHFATCPDAAKHRKD